MMEMEVFRPEVTEPCPHCDVEVTMTWDTSVDGYKAFCPFCGKRLMLCDACLHEGNGDCDYDSKYDCCKHNIREEDVIEAFALIQRAIRCGFLQPYGWYGFIGVSEEGTATTYDVAEGAYNLVKQQEVGNLKEAVKEAENLPQRKKAMFEGLWGEFQKLPQTEGKITKEFTVCGFPIGTDCEEIKRWFKNKYCLTKLPIDTQTRL